MWGVAAYLAPEANSGAVGLPGRPTGETVYLTRVFGSRAFALGTSYLLSDAKHRTMQQRLVGLAGMTKGLRARRRTGSTT